MNGWQRLLRAAAFLSLGIIAGVPILVINAHFF